MLAAKDGLRRLDLRREPGTFCKRPFDFFRERAVTFLGVIGAETSQCLFEIAPAQDRIVGFQIQVALVTSTPCDLRKPVRTGNARYGIAGVHGGG